MVNNKMKRYSDYQEDKSKHQLTEDELKKVEWTKYKIIVPTQSDKEEIQKALRYLHDNMDDSDQIAVNQLAHEYHEINNIIVDEHLYNKLNEK